MLRHFKVDNTKKLARIQSQERETLMITIVEYAQPFALITLAGFVAYVVQAVLASIFSIIND